MADLSPCLRNVSSFVEIITRSTEGFTEIKRTQSSLPLEFITEMILSENDIGVCLSWYGMLWKSSMGFARGPENPVTSPSSSIPITRCPPSAFANAMRCLRISLVEYEHFSDQSIVLRCRF